MPVMTAEEREWRIAAARRRNSRPLRELTDAELLAISHTSTHARVFRDDIRPGLDSLGDLAAHEIDLRATAGED